MSLLAISTSRANSQQGLGFAVAVVLGCALATVSFAATEPVFVLTQADVGVTDRAVSRPSDALLRQFVLFSYRNLADDLIDGNGVYLRTVLDACGVRGETAAAVAELRGLLRDSETIPDFTRRLVGWVNGSRRCQ